MCLSMTAFNVFFKKILKPLKNHHKGSLWFDVCLDHG